MRIRLSRRHFRWHFRRQFVSNQNLQCNGELFLLLNKLFGTSTKRSHPVLLFMLAPSPLCVVDSSFSPHLLCGSAYHYMLIHCNYLEEGSGTKLFRITLLPDFGEYTWKFCLKLRPEKTWLFHLHRVEASLLHGRPRIVERRFSNKDSEPFVEPPVVKKSSKPFPVVNATKGVRETISR